MRCVIRNLRGVVLVSTDNPAPERFFNLCRMKKIRIWDITKTDKGCQFSIGAADYLQLKEPLKKCGMKLVILRKTGLPFFMFRYRKHYSFVAGMLLAASLLQIMSMFVWEIEVDGNSYYTDNVIVSYLQENDVYVGCRMSKVMCDSLEQKIRKDFDDITWVSAEKSGTKLIVHIKENDGDNVAGKAKSPSDIIASSDGVVESIVTRCGTPLVKKGDEVKTGDVLVSGEVVLYNDAKEPTDSCYVQADADILVRTSIQYENTVQRGYKCKIYTGKKVTHHVINVMGNVAELGLIPADYEKYDVVTEIGRLRLTKDFMLPVCAGRRIIYEYITEDGMHSEEEVTQILTDNYENYLNKLKKEGIQIVSDSVKIDITDVNAGMSGSIHVVMPFKERRSCDVRTVD